MGFIPSHTNELPGPFGARVAGNFRYRHWLRELQLSENACLPGPHWLQQDQGHLQHQEHPSTKKKTSLVNNTPIPSKVTLAVSPCCAYTATEHFYWTLWVDIKKAFEAFQF